MASTVYPETALRTRCDVDLYVEPDSVATTRSILLRNGYEETKDSGHQVDKQSFHKSDTLNVDHSIDLHWNLTGHSVIDREFTSRELLRNTVSCKDLPTSAFNRVYALLHACVHRAFHLPYNEDPDEDRLIWLYDISLLTCQLTTEEWVEFGHLAREKRVSRLVFAAINATSKYFPVREDFDHIEPDSYELSTWLLKRKSYWHVATDILGAESIQSMLAVTSKLFFPPTAYMLQKYDKQSIAWLPILYPYRIATGLVKNVF